jgi:hypothetical protein
MSLDSTFEFPKVLEESTWAWHDTFQQLFAKMQMNETTCEPSIISKFVSLCQHAPMVSN